MVTTLSRSETPRRPAYNVYAAKCPTRQALDRIADKWTALIIGLLAERPLRFGELRRAIEGISQKMLTQTLKSLERDGLVLRRAFPTVPVTVEYSLTKLGYTLDAPLAAVRAWAEQYIDEVLATRTQDAVKNRESIEERGSRPRHSVERGVGGGAAVSSRPQRKSASK